MNKLKMMRQVGVLLIAFLLALAACTGPRVKTIKPYRGSIQRSFSELAMTRLKKIYDINMPLSGDLERIALEPGDRVTKDQVLVRLVQLPWEREVEKAETSLKSATASYRLLAKELERREGLIKSGAVSLSELDKFRFEVRILEKQMQHAQAILQITQYDLKRSTIRSPVDGIVLKRFTEGHKWLSVGEPLLQIGDLKELEVEAEVLSQDAQQLKIGDSVVFTGLGENIQLYGKVTRIDPAGFTKLSSLGVEEQRVYVITNISNIEETNLGVAYRLQAQFFFGKREDNALLVPRFSVLQDEQERFYVIKVVGGKWHKQVVTIGISSDKEIAIVKGLSDKDTIIEQPDAEMLGDIAE